MTNPIQATQEDREAAIAAFADCTFRQVCEIFARHRIAAEHRGYMRAVEDAARVAERRIEQRFTILFGTRKPDSNTTYYPGPHGDTLEALDEECEDIATAIRNLKPEGGQ